MYDDFNELFWDVERVKKLLPLSGTPEQASAQFCAIRRNSALFCRNYSDSPARPSSARPVRTSTFASCCARRRSARAARRSRSASTSVRRTARRWAGFTRTPRHATRIEGALAHVPHASSSPRSSLHLPQVLRVLPRLHLQRRAAPRDDRHRLRGRQAVVALPLHRDRHAFAAHGVASRSRHLADAPLAVQGERSSAQFWRNSAQFSAVLTQLF